MKYISKGFYVLKVKNYLIGEISVSVDGDCLFNSIDELIRWRDSVLNKETTSLHRHGYNVIGIKSDETNIEVID